MNCLGPVWFTFFYHSISITHHSSFITQFPSLITHHSKYQGCSVPSLSFHHSLFFTLFGGPTPVTVHLFFFFFQVPRNLNPVKKKPQWRRPNPMKKKGKKKKPMKTEPSEEEEEKKKKNLVRKIELVRKKKKKKSQLVKRCSWVGSSCVFNYKNVIELWVMETENSQKVFSVSITHNSKIRELSDGNKKLKTELWLAKQTSFYNWDGSHHFWELSYENWELSDENWWIKRPLTALPNST